MLISGSELWRYPRGCAHHRGNSLKNASVRSAGLACVAALVCFAISACAKQPDAGIVENEMGQIKEIAAKKYPDLPPEEAAARVAAERNNARMESHSVPDQQILAAVGFSTFFRANTSARASYCTEIGVDISPFIAAFQQGHGVELSTADAIFRASGTDFDQDWQSLRPSAEAWARNDMQQIASQRGTDASGACSLFASEPAEVARLLSYSDTKPEERAILLSYQAAH